MSTLVSDGSRADVQSKIDLAVSGDVVTLPAGTFAWDSGVTILGKVISVRGAYGGTVQGVSRTSLSIGTGTKVFSVNSASLVSTGWSAGQAIIARYKVDPSKNMTGTVVSYTGGILTVNVTSVQSSGTFDRWYFEVPAFTVIQHNAGASDLLSITESTVGSVRLSGVQLIKGTGTGHLLFVSRVTSGHPIVIKDCRFSKAQISIRWESNRGLIKNTYFDTQNGWRIEYNNQNNWNAIQHVLTFATDDWTMGSSLGALDTNGNKNLYIENCFFEGFTLGLADFSDNSRAVFRRSVWDNSAVTIHGPDTGPYGMRQLEVYDNVLIFDDSGDLVTAGLDYWITWRGGSGVVMDNVMPDLTSFAWGNKTEVRLECQMIRRNAGPYACWTGGYPVPRQTGQGYDNGAVVEGVYIWNNSGGVAGLGQYNPDECGNGLLIGTFLQVNRDYFLSAKSGYAKYEYPHPLGEEATEEGQHPPPVITPPGGNYSVPVNVTISFT